MCVVDMGRVSAEFRAIVREIVTYAVDRERYARQLAALERRILNGAVWRPMRRPRSRRRLSRSPASDPTTRRALAHADLLDTAEVTSAFSVEVEEIAQMAPVRPRCLWAGSEAPCQHPRGAEAPRPRC